jgi:hypothetical protein
MDLVDRVESTRFLGGEFLLWLWFSRDVADGQIAVEGLGTIEVSLESQVTLGDPIAEQERVAIRGADPFGTPEAEQALCQGKLPRKIGLRLTFQDSEWVLALDATTLGCSGVKLPALLTEGEEEHFFERMRLLEQMHDLIGAIYAQFLGIRLSAEWESTLVPALVSWVGGDVTMSRRKYDGLHRRVLARAKSQASAKAGARS